MDSRAEIQEIEREISELKKGLISTQDNLKRASKAVEQIQDKVLGIETSLRVARSNLRHMKRDADHVVLEEFQNIRTKERELVEDLEGMRIELAKAQSNMTKLAAREPVFAQEIKSRVDKLSQYGKVVKPPKKRKNNAAK